MTYKQWLRTYNSRKQTFIEANEREFGRLLVTARRGIPIPDEVNDRYRKHISGVLGDFTDNYETTMGKRMSSAAKFELAGATLLSAGFIKAIAGRATIPDDPTTAIAETVVETAFSRTLPSGLTLSERIWDLNYTNDIISIVNNGITANLSPEMIARQLDSFVLPGRQVTTLTPYGRTLNFDSMRLARTEVMNAFRATNKEELNLPWVTGQVWVCYGSNPCDDCQAEEGKVYGPGDTFEGLHPHDECGFETELMPNDEWDAALDNYFQTGTDDIGIAEWLQE